MIKDPILAVIIITKNRAKAIESYALSGLQKSAFRDFICIVWDASDDDSTCAVVQNGSWQFPLEYFKASRVGSSSQRNDAVNYVIKNKPSIRYVLFIDDDSELFRETIGGMMETIEDESVWGVNIPNMKIRRGRQAVWGCGRVTPLLANLRIRFAPFGKAAQWCVGCSMAFRIEVFSVLNLRFPEALERFGGYALAEDVVFTAYLTKKMGKTIKNSKRGFLCHHKSDGGRLDLRRKTAARWFNYHVFFALMYDDVGWSERLALLFLFKIRALSRVLASFISSHKKSGRFTLDPFRGAWEARAALRAFWSDRSELKHDISSLIRIPSDEPPTQQ